VYRNFILLSCLFIFLTQANVKNMFKQDSHMSKSGSWFEGLNEEIPIDKFFVIGDFGYLKHPEGLENMTNIMNYLNAEKDHDLIITGGDNFYPSGIESIDDLEDVDEVMTYFDKKNIKDLQLYATLGNNDCEVDYKNEILYQDFNDKWNMPNDYYEMKFPLKDNPEKFLVLLMCNSALLTCKSSFLEQENSLVVCEDMLVEVGEQRVLDHYSWLEERLEMYSNNEDIAWLGLVLHHPPVLEASLKQDLLPLLQKHKVDFSFVGHKHQFEYNNIGYEDGIRFPGQNRGPILEDCDRKEILNNPNRNHTFEKGAKLHQFMIGASGKKLKDVCPYKDQDGDVYFQNVEQHGLLSVDVDSEHFTVKYYQEEGEPFYEVTITS